MENFPKTFKYLKNFTLLFSFTLVFFLTIFYPGNIHTRSDYEFPVITNNLQKDLKIDSNNELIKIKEPLKPRDPKAISLEYYLNRQRSPLAKQADLIIDLAKLYGVDYKIIIAIAGLESGYCNAIGFDNNCWGFGSYSWSSMETGVKEYFRLMNKGYFSKGRITIQDIAPIYNPNTESFLERFYIHYNKIP